MEPKLLVKLAQPFVSLKFISTQQAQFAIEQILHLSFWTQPQVNNVTFISNETKPELVEHLANINELRQYLATFISEPAIIENRINEILSYFMPSNEIIQTWDIQDKHAKLLVLSQYAYYIKTDQNARNQIYTAASKYGDLTISINLAKPEKTQAQIIAEKNAISNNPNEPKCGICIENLNFHGSLTKPSRENLRVVYENLNHHAWFFQYSPYAYLNGHFVINDLIHQPMKIDNDSIIKLLSFVDAHPEFMLGSNADLPIVGGSLLGHNHFQGALERLPITKAKAFFKCTTHDCLVELLSWPLNTVKVLANNMQACIKLVNHVIEFWKTTQTPGIINDNNQTVTLITEKINHTYVCYVILRNNSTNAKHPQGIFHVHAEKFHIKQENIGLMEAAGLAILPGRLINEFKQILDLYSKNDKNVFLEKIKQDNDVKKHAIWIVELLNQYPQLTMEVLLKATANVFIEGLEDCQVLNTQQFTDWFKLFLLHHPVVVENQNGLKIECFNIGNIIKQIYYHDQPLLLEFKDASQYMNNQILLNAFVGPACGRIQNGKLIDHNINTQLPVDKNGNYMHGMQHKWSDLIYDIKVEQQPDNIVVSFITTQNNPDLNVIYEINNQLIISQSKPSFNFNYNVNCNRDSLCNPSHHFYWNLNSLDLLNEKLTFSPHAIWKLNEHKNPIELITIDLSRTLTVKNWMHALNAFTQQNEHLIDHPFVLNNQEIKLTTNKIELSVIPSIQELVIYTYFSQIPSLFKYNHEGICFESQYVPTSFINMNVNKVLSKTYRSQVRYSISKK